MKKVVYSLLVLLVIGVGAYLYGPAVYEQYFGTEVVIELSDNDHAVADVKDDNEEETDEADEDQIEEIIDDSEYELEAEREKTEAERLIEALKAKPEYEENFEMKILTEEPNTEIHEIYQDLSENVAKNVATKKTVDDVLPSEDEGGVKRSIQFSVQDAETGEGIEGATVLLRGGVIGQTTSDGVIFFERVIPRSHDFLYFQVRKVGYTPAYVKENLMYSESVDINISTKISAQGSKITKTQAKDISVKQEKVEVAVKDDCALLNISGDCQEGEVIVQTHYIKPDQVNNLSVPMQALVNGEVVNLVSNGMSFTNFYNMEGEILSYNNKKATVCYNVGEEQIVAWQKAFKEDPSAKDGYRWFDDGIGYWKYDKDAKVSIQGGKFCVETIHIY